jgi:hypothetical protein
MRHNRTGKSCDPGFHPTSPGLAALLGKISSNEVQRNQVLGREAIEFILEHPLTALKLRISIAYYFWFGS